MSWLNILSPSNIIEKRVIDAFNRLSFWDGDIQIVPSGVDIASFSLLKKVLLKGLDLNFQLPRGSHDFAIFCGIYAQLVRLVARYIGKTIFQGPVVVIGMNTMVQDRLRKIQLKRISLADGLRACRVRYDSKIVDSSGNISSLNINDSRLLYLNTRVGWPKLDVACVGVVIIDSTSFSDLRILQRALAWAENHQSKSIIVISDLGDSRIVEILERNRRRFLVWPWIKALINQVSCEYKPHICESLLSTNNLLLQKCEADRCVLCIASAVDGIFKEALVCLNATSRIDETPPHQIISARRLFYGLALCLSTIDEYNQWAALDYRTTAFSTLRNDINYLSSSSFYSLWRTFYLTKWATLHYSLNKLYNFLLEENPKLFTLALLLERLIKEEKNEEIVVRVTSEAAGHALSSNLVDFNIELKEFGPVRWETLSSRRPWTSKTSIEIYPGILSKSRHSYHWSGESTNRLYLLYPWERELLAVLLKAGYKNQSMKLEETFTSLDLSGLPDFIPEELIPIDLEVEMDHRKGHHEIEVNLGMDTALLVSELGDQEEEEISAEEKHAKVKGFASAYPIILEPSGECWWVSKGKYVEILIGKHHNWISVDELKGGETVIVPRGEGREDLFKRLVTARHKHSDIQAFDVFFSRWRRACLSAYENCGCSWIDLGVRMSDEGSSVTWQAIRSWIKGFVIAPNDWEDIARIGHLAGDLLVEKEARRLAKMATEIRGLHIRLGRLLSAAMSEAFEGSGPHLDALKEVMGDINVSEILEEFELRRVKAVGEITEVPVSKIGQISPPSKLDQR